jgi:hypothetical protein
MLLQSRVVKLRGAISTSALSPMRSPAPEYYREVIQYLQIRQLAVSNGLCGDCALGCVGKESAGGTYPNGNLSKWLALVFLLLDSLGVIALDS